MNNRIPIMLLGSSPDILEGLVSDLEILGFCPFTGSYPEIDLEDITGNAPDIILIDLVECDYRSLFACETILREENRPPGMAIVALVSKTSMGQIPLEYTFDEIIAFPYNITELSFRLRRLSHLYRRDPGEDTLQIGTLTISPSMYEVKVDGQTIPFSHKEYELFKFLITHPSHVFTREELFETIWGHNHLGESRTVDVHIRRIRAKIGDSDQTYIRTVRGVGYTFRFDNN